MKLVAIGSREFINDNSVFAETAKTNPCNYFQDVKAAETFIKKIPPHLIIIEAMDDLHKKLVLVNSFRKKGFRTDIGLVVKQIIPQLQSALEKMNTVLLLKDQIGPLIEKTIEETSSKKIERHKQKKISLKGIDKEPRVRKTYLRSGKQKQETKEFVRQGLQKDDLGITDFERSGIEKGEQTALERSGLMEQEAGNGFDKSGIERQEGGPLELSGIEKNAAGGTTGKGTDGKPTAEQKENTKPARDFSMYFDVHLETVSNYTLIAFLGNLRMRHTEMLGYKLTQASENGGGGIGLNFVGLENFDKAALSYLSEIGDAMKTDGKKLFIYNCDRYTRQNIMDTDPSFPIPFLEDEAEFRAAIKK